MHFGELSEYMPYFRQQILDLSLDYNSVHCTCNVRLIAMYVLSMGQGNLMDMAFW